jgi:hypothetical protein
MATSQESPVKSVDDPHVPASDVFDEFVWYNPEICNNCFQHIRDVDETTIYVGPNNQRELDWEYRSHTKHATVDHDVDPKGSTGTIVTRDDDGRAIGVEARESHSAKYQKTTRTTCLECGVVGALATDETLSRRDALTRVDALAARLDDGGVTYSMPYLRRTVRRGKTGKYRAYDREIFTAAVTVAIQKG